MNTGDRIKKLRKELDLTQQKFGEHIGIKGNTVAQYELGRSNPIDAVLSLICREFNVNEEWLRTGKGEMFKPAPTDVLDQLAYKYHLSNADYVMIEKFVNLKSETRQAIFDYFQEVVTAITDDEMEPHKNAYSGEQPPRPLDSILEKSQQRAFQASPELSVNQSTYQFKPLEMPEGSMPDLLRRINANKSKDA